MKKFSILSLLAVMLLSLAMVFTACSSGDDGPSGGPSTGGEDEVETVETTVFDLANNAGIQALTPGTIANSDFAGSGNPIAPLVRAGGDSNISIEIVDNNGTNAVKFTVLSGDWGVGIDLPYATFGFKAGDVVTVTGTVLGGTGPVQLNSNVGGENALDIHRTGGDFTLTATLTSANVTQIAGGNPAGIRIEARASGMIVQITSITIVGQRPATTVQLDAPEIEVTETGISWDAVENATGYKVYAVVDGDDDDLIATLGAVTSVNLNNIDALEPGDYDVYIIATGPSGYTDSDASNVVSYTKPVPAVNDFTLKVDDVDQAVEVKAVSGGIEVLEAGNGFTFTKGANYEGSYAYFGVTFDGTDTLSSFKTVKFKVVGVKGDIGYKNVSLIASTTAFSGTLNSSNPVNAQWFNQYYPSPNGGFGAGPQFNGTTELASSFTIVKEKADTYTGSTVYFSIYEAASASASGADTTFSIYDIEFIKDGGAVTTATLDKIFIKTAPTTTTYQVDDEFDPTGFAISADYLYTSDSGYRTDITYSANAGITFTGADTSAIGTKTVTATFGGQTTTFTITVQEGEVLPPEEGTAFNVTLGSAAPVEVTVIPGSNGTIEYLPGNVGYTYTYGTAANSNYGNAIVRFKLDLGDKTLGDYEKVTFKWTGVSGDAANYKKVNLLATDTEADITPYKNDDGIIALIVNGANMDAGPQMNGTTTTPVELTITRGGTLTGEVWFSIFENASGGAYTISDLVFVLAE